MGAARRGVPCKRESVDACGADDRRTGGRSCDAAGGVVCAGDTGAEKTAERGSSRRPTGPCGIRTAAAAVLVLSLAAVSCACTAVEKQSAGGTHPPLVLSPHGTAEPSGSEGTLFGDGLPPSATTAQPETAAPTERPVFSETFSFTGGAYCILDAASGSVLLARNGEEQLYIASITKLLTALVAVDYFKMDEKIEVRAGYLDLIRANPDIDAYGMKEGQSYLVGDLLKMLLLRSYGDAALALQYGTEERTGRNFLDLMNEKAAVLGMSRSHFDNPIGLDTGNDFPNNYSTAQDAARLMLAAYRSEAVFSVCSLRETVLSFGEKLSNSNALMGDAYASEQYVVLCGKTGSTKASGYNLACVAQGSEDGAAYVLVYLHGASPRTMNNELSEMIASLF